VSFEQERKFNRKEASQFLTDQGYRIAPATLAKLACVGGGPVFETWGRRPLYREADLLAWAQSRTTGPRRSTSDPGPKPTPAAEPATPKPPKHYTREEATEIVARVTREVEAKRQRTPGQ
jgi:hypothetical protein